MLSIFLTPSRQDRPCQAPGQNGPGERHLSASVSYLHSLSHQCIELFIAKPCDVIGQSKPPCGVIGVRQRSLPPATSSMITFLAISVPLTIYTIKLLS